MVGIAELELFVKGLVSVAVAASAAYAFVKTLDITKSFARALLAVSVLVDFYLIILWLLGVDRTIAVLELRRINVQVAITALTLFIPLKLVFTVWLWLRARGVTA